jgi:UDP-N-acetyl-D-glucosamine dehydrogenase
LGVAYKRDIEDVRESPALDIMHLLKLRGADATFSDPYVPSVRIENDISFSTDLFSSVHSADCVVIITDHSGVDYASVVNEARLIVDTRNALRGIVSPKIVRLYTP